MILRGSSYTLRVPVYAEDAGQYRITIQQDKEVIQITDRNLDHGMLVLDIRAVAPGKAYLEVAESENYGFLEVIYVHRLGIITVGGYLGNTAGAGCIPVLAALYLVLLLGYVIRQLRRDMGKSLYQYRNIRNMGWIIFLILMLAGQIPYLLSGGSLVDTVRGTLGSASNVAFLAFPIAFAVSILVAISNIQLMRKEGRNWRNMLGLMLGILVCASTIFPYVLSEFLQRTTLVDVHNENGTALYVEMAVTNIILVTVSYLECILWGTVILSIQAARRIPSYDQDYMLILGCQIKEDGTLTPLLKGRADRAVEFAEMQRKATGKELIFLPSGGQGGDEIIPEARAIGNYLVSAGIPGAQILVEDKSANTYENFQNALKLIQEENRIPEPKVAFSTTNYHVFRSGILAERQGIHAQGIGSKTRSYFWVNAFVREFIATVYAEWKKHLKVIVILALLTLALVFVVRMANIL